MKKIFVMAMLSVFAISGTAAGQSAKQQQKADKKAVAARVKEFSAEGWKSLQSEGLSELYKRHHDKLTGNPDLMEFVGTAEGVKTTNMGMAKARSSAIAAYAEYCSGMLRSRITTDLQDINAEQADNLVSGYERILAQKLEKDLRPSYYMYRDAFNGYDVRGFFLVDESEMAKKQLEALKEAANQAKLAFDYANGISDFIKEGFDKK